MLELIGKKIGMSHSYKANGSSNALTMVEIYDNTVIDIVNKNDIKTIKIAFKKIDNKKLSKSIVGFFNSKKIPSHKYIKESKTISSFSPEIGHSLDLSNIAKVGDKISIQGISSGKGFAGVMKRWSFGGLEASHGVSISHRSHGSTGQRQDPGKTFKGKKMAGHLGCDTVTVKNLNIEFIDLEKSIIGISGSIPGNNGENVVLKFKNI